MNESNSPLRMLVKTYASGLLERQQYLDIRQQLLKKLASQGNLTDDDLQNFLSIYRETDNDPAPRRYSASDWIIIALGLVAAAVLGTILYS